MGIVVDMVYVSFLCPIHLLTTLVNDAEPTP
jgi:hypothetical protein